MMDEHRARELATAALERWGRSGPVAVRPIPGGWRAHTEAQAGDATGTSHALVRTRDAAVLRCPAGTSDRVAAELLRRAPAIVPGTAPEAATGGATDEDPGGC